MADVGRWRRDDFAIEHIATSAGFRLVDRDVVELVLARDDPLTVEVTYEPGSNRGSPSPRHDLASIAAHLSSTEAATLATLATLDESGGGGVAADGPAEAIVRFLVGQTMAPSDAVRQSALQQLARLVPAMLVGKPVLGEDGADRHVRLLSHIAIANLDQDRAAIDLALALLTSVQAIVLTAPHLLAGLCDVVERDQVDPRVPCRALQLLSAIAGHRSALAVAANSTTAAAFDDNEPGAMLVRTLGRCVSLVDETPRLMVLTTCLRVLNLMPLAYGRRAMSDAAGQVPALVQAGYGALQRRQLQYGEPYVVELLALLEQAARSERTRRDLTDGGIVDLLKQLTEAIPTGHATSLDALANRALQVCRAFDQERWQGAIERTAVSSAEGKRALVESLASCSDKWIDERSGGEFKRLVRELIPVLRGEVDGEVHVGLRWLIRASITRHAAILLSISSELLDTLARIVVHPTPSTNPALAARLLVRLADGEGINAESVRRTCRRLLVQVANPLIRIYFEVIQ